MIKNNCEITYIKGIGEKRAQLYSKLGINSLEELITYYPRDYIDYSDPRPINEIENGETCVFRGTVTKKLKPYFSGKITIYHAVVSDDTDEMLLTFFNTQFSFDKLVEKQSYLFYGKVTCDFAKKEVASPLFIPESAKNVITPKYPLTKGLSNNMVSQNISAALEKADFEDLLPQYICEREQLLPLEKAVNNIHFPESLDVYLQAQKRLAFEELLVLQLGLSLLGKKKRKANGIKMKKVPIKDFFEALPFEPTGAQKAAIKDCIADMCGELPMNRLLQGDVGSGKTLVAAAVMYFVVKNGYQATLMAPTEILAKQHRDTLSKFLEPLGVTVELLTGSMTEKEKREARKRIESGEAQVVAGTHALIQKSVVFANLALSVTDEQHRFGVEQRSTLQAKGENPHSLVMSATPIPRTLALMIYADLDISVLNEMPKGRLPIKTYGVDSGYHQRLYNFIIKYVKEGYQAYIVCPLVEEGITDKASAVKYFETLQNGALKGISMGLLHGRMKQADKDQVMSDFKENRISVLVATTVVEVGVDVPNAVVMIIENAEQFGLSQLHQLRGRVGRGNTQSHCILVTDSKNEYTRSRVDTMVATCDGFKIANKDLELRGPGDFFGSAQHGLPALKIANMTRDIEIVYLAQKYSAEILEEDDTLSLEKNMGLRQLVSQLFKGGEKYGIN
ncbi:MAG: ATP-dependent DNA helicase RecG [Ruminococcaceae bacterium]|nr:ATP-dependent DNA helicase RecG [Oscillospiraceae bacterium]